MKKLTQFALAGLLSFISIGVSLAADGYIVRTKPGAGNAFASQFGSAAKAIGHDVFHVRAANNALVHQALSANPHVLNVENNNGVAVPETVAASSTKFAISSYKGKLGTYWNQVPGAPAVTAGAKTFVAKPSSLLYLLQPGILKIRVPDPSLTSWRGAGVKVAVIDTWIDGGNSWLAPVVDRFLAYDAITKKGQYDPANTQQETSPFIDQETSPFIDSTGSVLLNQETSPFIDSKGNIILNQETSPFIDSKGNLILNQETSPFIDQETSPFIDQETSPFIDQETSPFIDKNGQSLGAAYAHGTMVAGLVHRVAWDATIVPIRAFHNDGSGSMADVIAGIYYAVDVAKVNVLSMSFSAPSDSPELKKAINYAQQKGVICVAAVSNSDSSAKVYPAAEDKVLGIAATDYNDFKASFSDYGSDVTFAAPGWYMTSTAPRDTNNKDHWGMSSGTSFATPCVAGAVAVLKALNFAIDPESITKYLAAGADPILDPAYRNQLGKGRLDVFGSASVVANGK
jgi:hypothetical protein